MSSSEPKPHSVRFNRGNSTTVADAPVYGQSYQQFVAFLRDPGETAPVLSPRKYAIALKIDLQDLADQAPVHRNTIARAPYSKEVQDYLRQALRLIKAGTDLSGDVSAALFWYRDELLAIFGYKTAETLVIEGRADDVLQYLG